ncbi:hypothetical protein EXH51_26450, partial [Pelomonas saccharophila]|nr:hypothetical protein [Roseateles saccharophilus]
PTHLRPTLFALRVPSKPSRDNSFCSTSNSLGLRAQIYAGRNSWTFSSPTSARTSTNLTPQQFDTAYMRKLFDYGYRPASEGRQWHKAPPGE